jgi:hypothetical protein
MLRERNARGTAPDDVMATLAELDEKLEALERGMAAARSGAQPAGGAAAAPTAARDLAPSAVADFQAAARSRSERRYWQQPPGVGGDHAPREVPVEAEETLPLDELVGETGLMRAGDPLVEPIGGALGAYPVPEFGGNPLGEPIGGALGAYPVPEFGWTPELPVDASTRAPDALRESALRSAGVAVDAGELAAWRERIGRAIDELGALRMEIELASARHDVFSDGRSTAPTAAVLRAGAGSPAPVLQPGPMPWPTDQRRPPMRDITPHAHGPAAGGGAGLDDRQVSAAGRTPTQSPAAEAFLPTSAARGTAPAPAATAEPARSGDAVARVPSAAPTAPPAGVRLPVPMPHDRLFDGHVLVDAGPFLDIAAVTAFQRALEAVPGARGVDVTALDLDRAHLELDLTDPVALGREIRAVFPFNFAIFEAGHGRLSINVDTASLAARQRPPAAR